MILNVRVPIRLAESVAYIIGNGGHASNTDAAARRHGIKWPTQPGGTDYRICIET